MGSLCCCRSFFVIVRKRGGNGLQTTLFAMFFFFNLDIEIGYQIVLTLSMILFCAFMLLHLPLYVQ